MRVIYEVLPKHIVPCVATIGTFDGVHRGHQKIIKAVITAARKRRVASLVITFDRHPRLVLNKQFGGCVTTLEDKKAILAGTGIDYAWFLKTACGILEYRAHNFLSWAKKYFDFKELIVGDDFRFGKDALHGAHTMDTLAKKFGFRYRVLSKQKISGKVISSSRVRELILAGDVKAACRLLGRDYSFKGEVVTGEGKGRILGFPTANICAGGHIIPGNGVYAARVCVNNKKYPAAVNIGTKPTVSSTGELTIEAHILNFKKNIVGKTIEIFFLDKLRGEKKFSSKEDLIEAIARDIEYIKKYYIADAYLSD